jgi:uncharacterized protein YkwD
VVRGRILGVLATALVAVSFVAPSTAPARPTGQVVSLTSLERGVLTDVNRVRNEHGLAPLRLSAQLTAAARQHSASMVAKGYFGHDSADGSTFFQRIRHYYAPGRSSYWSVGENLLWSSPDVDAGHALQMWLASPPHRENLLSGSWRQVGISAIHVDSAPGTYGGHAVTVITADFGVRR